MSEETIYTEQELSEMADAILADTNPGELIPEPPKSRKSEPSRSPSGT